MFNYDTMKLFFAMLAIAANIAVIVYLGVAIGSRWSSGLAQLRERLNGTVRGYEMTFGAVAAGTATLGSLYLSEVVHLIPCTLCWYQRIAMYPLAVILALAAIKRDGAIRIYALVLATIGSAIAAYHYVIQWFPDLEGTSCSTSVPCTGVWFREFGFISIPYLALSTFTLVIVLMWAHRSNTTERA